VKNAILMRVSIAGVLLLIIALVDLFGPQSEAENFCDKFVKAINDAADSLAQVKDSASARAAVGDVRSKLANLSAVLSQLGEKCRAYKDVEITKLKEKMITWKLESAAQRFKNELERVQQIPNLPVEFIDPVESQLSSMAEDARKGMYDDSAFRMPSHSRLPARQHSFFARPDTQPVARTSPSAPVETPAQMQERQRQQQELERQAEAERERQAQADRERREQEVREADKRHEEQFGPESNDPQYFEKQLKRLNSSDRAVRDSAMAAMLEKKPGDVASSETRKQIAKAIKRLAEQSDANWIEKSSAIKGLVIWGGKFSGPILLKLLGESHGLEQTALIQALGEIKYEPAIDAIAAKIGEAGYESAALRALKEFGPEAEDAVMQVALSEKAHVCTTAVKFLGDYGTKKCLPLLTKGLSSRSKTVRVACREAMEKVRARAKEQKRNRDSEDG
jgi:hypothetical protein